MKEKFKAETLRGLYQKLSSEEKRSFYNFCTLEFHMVRNTLQHKMCGSTEFKYMELLLLIPAIQKKSLWIKY